MAFPEVGQIKVAGKLTADAPLALVWFKSGGRAEWLFEPKDVADLCAFLEQLPPPVPVMALGWVEPDRARWRVPGVVIRLGKAFARVERLTI
jgi:UDP-N-acetylmuramate dehydrogenase